MIHGSLFSGIGGFDLAAEWMGWDNAFHCEWNPFGQKVLKYYWHNAKSYEDITKTDFTIHRGTIDIITGGFPCQPYSQAGKRLGKEDERHLWPEMLRAIREIQPRYIVGENVSGLVNWNGGMVFEEVQAQMEDQGYQVTPFILPACSVNAPHRRDRVWFVAYSESVRSGKLRNKTEKERTCDCNELSRKCNRIHGYERTSSNTISRRWIQDNEQQSSTESKYASSGWNKFPTQSPVCSRNDGVPSGLDGITFPKWRSESIKAAGNAIVPHVALQIFKAIEQFDKL